MNKRLLIFLIGVLLLSLPIKAQESDTVTRLQQIMQAEVENGFSGAVLVAEGGEVLFSEAYGVADRAWDIPNTTNTKFYLGPLTKQFTAMAVLVLHERGDLSLDDSICEYFDPCLEDWEQITIHNLLIDNSGLADLPNFVPVENSPATTPDGPMTPDAVMDMLRESGLVFSPGEQWMYINTGYILLGLIIEDVSGSSYADFMTETFFEPLGLDDTGYATDDEVVERLSEVYLTGSDRKAPEVSMDLMFSAGGLYSTVEDMHTWNQAMMNGEVVSQETWDMIWEAEILISPELRWYTSYGLAHTILPQHDDETIWFGGGINGYTTGMNHYVNSDVTIIVLGNVRPYNLIGLWQQLEVLLLPSV